MKGRARATEQSRRQDPTSECLGRSCDCVLGLVHSPACVCPCQSCSGPLSQCCFGVSALSSILQQSARDWPAPPPKAHRGSGNSVGGGGGSAISGVGASAEQAEADSNSSGPAMMEARLMRLERERNMLKLEMDRQRLQFEEERQACEHSSRMPGFLVSSVRRVSPTRTSWVLSFLSWQRSLTWVGDSRRQQMGADIMNEIYEKLRRDVSGGGPSNGNSSVPLCLCESASPTLSFSLL